MPYPHYLGGTRDSELSRYESRAILGSHVLQYKHVHACFDANMRMHATFFDTTVVLLCHRVIVRPARPPVTVSQYPTLHKESVASAQEKHLYFQT
eukprot:COSAG01_NODE_3628_length_5843_cov_9.101008_5_plen_95_part_00